MLDSLDADAVRRWALAAARALHARRDEIDELNVFPVADFDTGTNLALTVRAGADAAERDRSVHAAAALAAFAHGAVLGARGNSGVIMAQLLRGLAAGVHAETCDGPALQRALSAAATQAYASVHEPQEGTILSVARAAADRAGAVTGGAVDGAGRRPARRPSLAAVIEAALAGAQVALARTSEQLPVLARAGVVDAGGRGLVVVLDALLGVVTGRPTGLGHPSRAAPGPRRRSEGGRATGGPTPFGYEVQYLLDAPASAMPELRATLAAAGDSLAVVGADEGVWNVHLHTDDIGAAIEAGIRAGRPHRITVQRFADVDRQADPDRQVTDDTDTVRAPDAVSVLVLLASTGLARLFQAPGVRVVVATGDAVADLQITLRALRSVGASTPRVVLLPADAQLSAIAFAAADRARAQGIEVAVVPTRSPVQGLAALAVHDPARRRDDDVIAMAEAAGATHFAEVSVAAQASLTTIGPCRAGDALGLIDGEVVEIGRSLAAVAFLVLDRLLGTGGELITVVTGPGAPVDIEASIRSYVGAHAPFIEVVSFNGESADCPLLIGME